jgi:hypothetical protein
MRANRRPRAHGPNEKENGARGNGAAGMRATWMGKPERVRLRENAESSGATWTGSPKGVSTGRKHHKPRVALNNNTAGVRELSEWSGRLSDIERKTTRVGASECGQRTRFNRTREAGNRDEVEGVVASTLDLFRNEASLLANGAMGTRAR